ncbi:MAG: hypothetical protein AB7N24_13470 [Dehalococcoidia bacterium]
MQFESKYRAGIADGSIDLTFRRWKRPQVIAGNTYRTAAGRLVVDSISVVAPGEIDDTSARRAGYPDAASLVADLRGDEGLPICRVAFHVAPGADPRSKLAAVDTLSLTEVADIRKRLERLDKASPIGPWTFRTLKLVADNPKVRAGDLAPSMERELLAFKLNVRKLKNLGLTISLGVGYELSPRGAAFLAALESSGG